MKRLEDLPQITEEVLGGLQATPGMKARIMEAAAAPQKKQINWMPRVAAVACALALFVGAALNIPGFAPHSNNEPVIRYGAAGDMAARGAGEEPALAAAGSDQVRVGSRSAGGSSLWAGAKGSSFPMIVISGRCYRMLTEPVGVSASLLGATVDTIGAFMDEPSLAAKGAVVSNAAAQGTAVRAVKGMDGAVVAAQVDGVLRLFQRVSFNGAAVQGKEKLADTLQAAGKISSMTLSGVGSVNDAAACERLYGILTGSAQFESSGSLSNGKPLTIDLSNGISLQMIVKGDKLAACGVWSCPEFIEAFTAAAN